MTMKILIFDEGRYTLKMISVESISTKLFDNKLPEITIELSEDHKVIIALNMPKYNGGVTHQYKTKPALSADMVQAWFFFLVHPSGIGHIKLTRSGAQLSKVCSEVFRLTAIYCLRSRTRPISRNGYLILSVRRPAGISHRRVVRAL